MTAKLPSAGQNPPDDINVIIEIPAMGEPIKYEFDKETLLINVDRFMPTAMYYPANYGFIPNTLSEDGDPMDVLVVTPVPLRPGVMIRSRPVGMLRMTDESGVDTKILAVPHDKLTPVYREVKDIHDLPELLLSQIKHFFEHYKDLEKGKWVKVESFESVEVAKKEIMASIKKYSS